MHKAKKSAKGGMAAKPGKKAPMAKYAKGGIVGKVMGEPHGGGTSKGMGCAKKGGSFSGVR